VGADHVASAATPSRKPNISASTVASGQDFMTTPLMSPGDAKPAR
jgi:hypothetical protein